MLGVSYPLTQEGQRGSYLKYPNTYNDGPYQRECSSSQTARTETLGLAVSGLHGSRLLFCLARMEQISCQHSIEHMKDTRSRANSSWYFTTESEDTFRVAPQRDEIRSHAPSCHSASTRKTPKQHSSIRRLPTPNNVILPTDYGSMQ